MLEAVGLSIGLRSGGRTRWVKPNRMAEAYPELNGLVSNKFVDWDDKKRIMEIIDKRFDANPLKNIKSGMLV